MPMPENRTSGVFRHLLKFLKNVTLFSAVNQYQGIISVSLRNLNLSGYQFKSRTL